MKKLTGMVLVLAATGVLLSGCYSKSCDTACPSTRVVTVKNTSNGANKIANSHAISKAKATEATQATSG